MNLSLTPINSENGGNVMNKNLIIDYNNITAEFTQYAPTLDTPLLIEDAIQFQYPGVPPPYNLAWARSDENAG